jgi:hypothetical protein
LFFPKLFLLILLFKYWPDLTHTQNGVGESLFPHTHFTVDYNSNPQWFFPTFFLLFFYFSFFFSTFLIFLFFIYFFFCFFQNYFCWFYFLNIDLVKIFAL